MFKKHLSFFLLLVLIFPASSNAEKPGFEEDAFTNGPTSVNSGNTGQITPSIQNLVITAKVVTNRYKSKANLNLSWKGVVSAKKYFVKQEFISATNAIAIPDTITKTKFTTRAEANKYEKEGYCLIHKITVEALSSSGQILSRGVVEKCLRNDGSEWGKNPLSESVSNHEKDVNNNKDNPDSKVQDDNKDDYYNENYNDGKNNTNTNNTNNTNNNNNKKPPTITRKLLFSISSPSYVSVSETVILLFNYSSRVKRIKANIKCVSMSSSCPQSIDTKDLLSTGGTIDASFINQATEGAYIIYAEIFDSDNNVIGTLQKMIFVRN